MIDRLNMMVYCPHTQPIGDGQILAVNPDNEVLWLIQKKLPVTGSYDSNLYVRTVVGSAVTRADGSVFYERVQITGNPLKFFQGHNLFGTDDVHGLGIETALAVLELVGVDVPEHLPRLWADSPGPNESDTANTMPVFWITGIDFTQMFEMESEGHVQQLVTLIQQSGHMVNRGRGHINGKGESVTFGKGSRRSSTTIYAKGAEVRKNIKHHPAIRDLPAALQYANRCLRVEHRLHSMELESRNMRGLGHYRHMEPEDTIGHTIRQLEPVLRGLTMTHTTELDPDVLASLSNGQRLAYLAWKGGTDLRPPNMPRNSFYRLRRKLLDHGIDIATPVPTVIPDNVVSLYDSLVPRLAPPVPDWAIGTPLYFEPRRFG